MSTLFVVSDSGGGLGSLFSALGLNWQALILNAIAVLIVVWVLGRFVFPTLIKALDAKREELEAATRHEQAARTALDEAAAQAAALIAQARTAADEVGAEARLEAADFIRSATAKAEVQSRRIVEDGRAQLAHDVAQARQSLKVETSRLVASATETLIGEKLDAKGDQVLIGRALEETR